MSIYRLRTWTQRIVLSLHALTVAALILFALASIARGVSVFDLSSGTLGNVSDWPQGNTNLVLASTMQAEIAQLSSGLHVWENRAVRAKTQAEINADGLAYTNALAAATYAANLPENHPVGIETPVVVLLDATNRTTGIGLEATVDGDLVTYQYHASPIDFAAVESNRAAATAYRNQMRLATKAIRTNIVALLDATSTNIAQSQAIVVSSTSSTAQVRSAVVDVRRELIDAHQQLRQTQQEIQNLRAVVRDIIKGSD